MIKRHIHQITEYFNENVLISRTTSDIDETDYNDYDDCCDYECCSNEQEGLLS